MTPEALTNLWEPVADLVRTACTQLVLPRFRALSEGEVQSKTSPNDLVTIADIEAEAWLTPRLADLLPGSLVIGEEASSRGEVKTDILTGPEPVWVIDPVDGTYNFVHGRETFCCMVALVQNRKVLASWIYFPTIEHLYFAAVGQGAYHCIGQSAPQRLWIEAPGEVSAITHRFFKQLPLKARKEEILTALAPTRPTQCAGFDYCQAAQGDIGLVAMASLTPWDHAPGTLIVAEAGGQVRLNGGTYDPTIDRGALISGGNRARIQDAERQLILP